MKYVVTIVSTVLVFLLNAPKVLGLTLMHYVDSLPKGQFADSGPGDLKAMEKAMQTALQVMSDNVKRVQDLATEALEEVKKEGTLHAKTNEALAALGEAGTKIGDHVKELQDKVSDLQQRLEKGIKNSPEQQKSIEQIILDSEQFQYVKSRPGSKSMEPVTIGSFHKTQIVSPGGQNQPLVPAMRVNGIIVPAEQRLTIRDLIPTGRTDSNLIEFASEATFTNNAGPQGGASPAMGEGELKNESAMTFTLDNSPVVTIAHWVPASRQVLSDAALLAGHINNRLIYGLKLEEEQEILTGAGTGGQLYGLLNKAAAFSYGVTNQTALDTLLKARLQVSVSNYDASGVVLNPIDWAAIVLLKDTTGRYLFANPQDVAAPRVWGLPVVATNSMTLGRFLMGAFNLAAQIWDREDATVRVSENVNDHFIRNLVAVLAEERIALTVYRPAALVNGLLSYAG
jgi:HK97 family phage major capsid protein